MLRFLALSLLSLLVGPARAAEPVEIAAWRTSVVRLEMAGSTCSGVVIDDAGTVATAYHCIAGARRPWVRTVTGLEVRGRVRATSARDDLALVAVPGLAGQVEPRPLRTTDLDQGETLWVIGHPLGQEGGEDTAWEGMLAWSVSRGVVSAVGPRLVQTDAALNPGTSGGPGLDDEGRVIGIVSRKLSGEGLSFLAHVDRLRALVQQPRTPWIGGAVAFGVTLPTPLVAGAARSAGLSLELQLRDRVVLGAVATVPVDARVQALATGTSTFASGGLHLALRQRLGQGPWSSTVNLGGALWQLVDVTAEWGEEQVWTVQRPRSYRPGGVLRLGTRGIGVRVLVLTGAAEPLWVMAVDADWPGALATF